MIEMGVKVIGFEVFSICVRFALRLFALLVFLKVFTSICSFLCLRPRA